MKEFEVSELRVMKQSLEANLDVPGEAFSYAVSKNLAKVNRALEMAAKKVRKNHPSFEYNEDFDKVYLPAFIRLEGEHGKKDETGALVRDESDNIVPKDAEAYKKELAALNKKHPGCDTILKERRKASGETEKYAYEIEFHKILKKDALPSQVTARMRFALEFMLGDGLAPGSQVEADDIKEVEDVPAGVSKSKEDVVEKKKPAVRSRKK